MADELASIALQIVSHYSIHSIHDISFFFFFSKSPIMQLFLHRMARGEALLIGIAPPASSVFRQTHLPQQIQSLCCFLCSNPFAIIRLLLADIFPSFVNGLVQAESTAIKSILPIKFTNQSIKSNK